MSRPSISSSERRGIIVLLAVIALCAVVAGVRRCTAERHAAQLYQQRAARLDSITEALSVPADTVSTSFVGTDSTTTSGKKKASRRKNPRKSTAKPQPERSPFDDPIN